MLNIQIVIRRSGLEWWIGEFKEQGNKCCVLDIKEQSIVKW